MEVKLCNIDLRSAFGNIVIVNLMVTLMVLLMELLERRLYFMSNSPRTGNPSKKSSVVEENGSMCSL